MSTHPLTRQFSTFFVANGLYGIEVTKVQEITKALPMAKIPLAPKYVHGLINLRGQISTAIGLRELFEIPDLPPTEQMNVVCKMNDVLVSFLVDRIGDVLEVDEKDFELAPETVPHSVRRFTTGVYKTQSSLLSVIDTNKIGEFFTQGSKDSSKENNI